MRSLTDRLDNYAEAWRPKPGDKLIGLVLALDERDSQYADGERYPIVTVDVNEDGSTEDGTAIESGSERAFHAYHTVARRELARQRPKVGDRIGIAYHGKPDGKTYESYRIIVESETHPESLDWERIGAAAEAEQPPEDDDDIPF